MSIFRSKSRNAKANFSAQPFSPSISAAFVNSPAAMNMSLEKKQSGNLITLSHHNFKMIQKLQNSLLLTF